ncbi:hypothetical protein GCM10023321_30140 [Pseudonocardia eucalypti]|uniref:RAMA domain-containing protein n=1 Tax=Pseudonocardia eucalypti TaxID=648755 RepID=A0ABP9Q3M9_9PSEU
MRDAFAKLADEAYQPTYPAVSPAPGLSSWTTHDVAVADLVDADLLPAGSTLLAAVDAESTATVLNDGRILFGSETYGSPSAAALSASGGARNGWTYWVADLADGYFSLSSLRDQFLSSRSATSG